jgi:hypothetical protein
MLNIPKAFLAIIRGQLARNKIRVTANTELKYSISRKTASTSFWRVTRRRSVLTTIHAPEL